MEILSNREIALSVWALILLILACSTTSIRKLLFSVVKHFFRRKIISSVFLFYAYVSFTVWGLSGFDLWDASQIKNTLIWSVFVGIAAAYKAIINTKKSAFFREWIIDNLRITILLEFIISFETFPLFVELTLQPFLFFLVIMGAHAEGKREFKVVSNFCNTVLAIAGLFVVVYAVYGVWMHFSEFATVHTLKDFYTPILLSLSLTPFLYAMYVYSSYERIFIGLHFSTDDEKLRRYIKWKAILSFGADIEFLDRWRRAVLLRKPNSKEDVRSSIYAVKELKNVEKRPPHIEPQDGWSPYAAQKYLGSGRVDYGFTR